MADRGGTRSESSPPGRRIRRGAPAALLLAWAACATLAPSPVDAAAEDPGALSLEPHVFATRDGDRVPAELGRLVVPETRSRPDARSLELAFVRLPATGDSPGPPVVYLAGGPGGSAIDAGRGPRFRLFDALRRTGDVLLLDQRGTGRSNPIEPEECPVERTYPSDRPIELEPYLELVTEVGRTCARFWADHGVDLSAYHTLESVADLEALRRALGVEQIRLVAISYGTHLALAYLRQHPDRVLRAVLAGVEGPDHTVKLPGQFDEQLTRLESLLAPRSPGESEALRPRIRTVLERLESDPVTVRVVDVEGPDREEILAVGPREVADVTMDLLQDPATMIQVPVLYEHLEAGDFTDVAGILLDLRTVGGLEAMPEAMDGASGISEERAARLVAEEEATLLGSGLLRSNVALAEGLGVPDLGPRFRAPVESRVPTLFISGTLDGRTPAANAREVLRGFPAGRHLIVENGGHGDDLLIGSPDLERAIVDFVARGETDVERVELPPPDPTAVRRRTALSPQDAARYAGEYERRPREIWRILHHTTVETRSSSGEPLFENATLQIRWNGDGFPFHPVSETDFYIDFPWFIDLDFRFETDDSGRITHLVFETRDGETVRMEKVH